MNNRDNILVLGRQLFSKFVSFLAVGMTKAGAVWVSRC